MDINSLRSHPDGIQFSDVLTSTRPLIHCASGSHWKTSLKRSNICEVYFAFTSPSNPYIWFMLSVSWFPRWGREERKWDLSCTKSKQPISQYYSAMIHLAEKGNNNKKTWYQFYPFIHQCPHIHKWRLIISWECTKQSIKYTHAKTNCLGSSVCCDDPIKLTTFKVLLLKTYCILIQYIEAVGRNLEITHSAGKKLQTSTPSPPHESVTGDAIHLRHSSCAEA